MRRAILDYDLGYRHFAGVSDMLSRPVHFFRYGRATGKAASMGMLAGGEHNDAVLLYADPFSFAMKFREVKRHLDKPDAVFACDPIVHTGDCVVLRYVNVRPGRVGDTAIRTGSVTYGYYRQGAGYVLWKMCDPEGRLLGHLFHICRNLEVGDRCVDYVDLLLDLWYDPEGRLTVLDRDELESCERRNIVSGRDMKWIARHEREIVAGAEGILDDFNRILDGWRTLSEAE